MSNQEHPGNTTHKAQKLKQAFKLEETMDPKRTLTEEDIEALLDAVEKKFYNNLGKGVWRIIWGVVLTTLVAIAYFGSHK